MADEHSVRVVREARAWIGTPYLHQASLRGMGCDCLGLIRGVWRALHGTEPCPLPAYTPDWAGQSRAEVLLEAAARFLTAREPEAAGPGDVLVFRMREGGPARHLGIQSSSGPAPRFIHAYSGHAVTENALTAPWARRIAGRFAFPASPGGR